MVSQEKGQQDSPAVAQLAVSRTRLNRSVLRGETQSWPTEGLAETNFGN